MADLETILWQQNPIFAAAGAAACVELAERHPAELIPPGTVVARVGEQADRLAVLLAGTVQIFHETADGRRTIVKLMRAPNVFGDIELLHGLAYLENVAAVDAIRLARIPAAEYQSLLDANPASTRRHLEHLAAAFCVVARNERGMLSPLEERLANLLLSYAELFGHVDSAGGIAYSRPLSQPEMAASLGVSVRAVAQVLADWTTAGFVAKRQRKVVLCDLDALRALALPVQGSLRYEMGMSLDHLARGGGSRDLVGAELRLIDDDDQTQGPAFPISESLIIGAQVPSQLRLPDDLVDAQHCRVFRATSGGKFWVEDLRSALGTELNGKRVTRAVLRDRDELRLGGARLRFLLCGGSTPSA